MQWQSSGMAEHLGDVKAPQIRPHTPLQGLEKGRRRKMSDAVG